MSAPEVTFAALQPDSGERFQSLRRALGVESFGINLIVLDPGQRGRIHDHSHQEEVFLVLEGELSLGLGEHQQHVLGQGELVRVPAGRRRRLINRGPAPLHLLALGGSGTHASRDGSAWETWAEPGPGRSPQEVELPRDLAPGESAI